MGKTPKNLVNKGFFIHKQPVNFAELFNKACEKKREKNFSTENLSTFHSLCGKTYRQELMFAVISRMLFCSAVSPICRAFSIFSTE